MNSSDQITLFTRYFSGEATAEERAEVEAWRQASSDHQRAFAEFERIWQNAAEELPHLPNVDQGWMELSARLGWSEEEGRAEIPLLKTAPLLATRKFNWSDRYARAVAAAILLGFAAILYQFFFNANALQKINTTYAQQRSVELPDGSLVQLNHDSEIQFAQHFADSAREVTLRGEAYFEIKRAPRPFMINTGNAQIKVLGTKFGIWARNEQTRITVREGRVSFRALAAPPAAAVILTANQASVCRKDGAPASPQSVDAGHLLAWREGKIIFDETPLAEVLAELQRVYNVTITLANPALGAHTITGSFHQKPVASVLASICLTLNLQFAQQGNNYVVGE